MSGVPIATVEDANGLIAFGRETAKEADKSYFVVDLFLC